MPARKPVRPSHTPISEFPADLSHASPSAPQSRDSACTSTSLRYGPNPGALATLLLPHRRDSAPAPRCRKLGCTPAHRVLHLTLQGWPENARGPSPPPSHVPSG